MKALSIWQPYASLIAINGNMIYDGVETDKNGKIVAYHIRKTKGKSEQGDSLDALAAALIPKILNQIKQGGDPT